MRDYISIPHTSGYFSSQVSGSAHTQELRRTLGMFLLSLILLSRCDGEGGLPQLQSCAGEPHTRLVVYTNHVHGCQSISALTQLKMENLTADFPRFLSILFNSMEVWGNKCYSVCVSDSINQDILRGWRYYR